MNVKKKLCKGTGDAKGYGCGTEQYERKYGLGIRCRCYNNWLLNTPEGLEVLKKGTLQGKNNVKKESKKKDAETRKSLMTKSDYEKNLQKVINAIARTIDKGTVCISSGRPLALKHDAGHYFSVGSNPSIRFNLFNIYAQSVEQNQNQSGNPIGFLEGLETMYGKDHAEYVRGLKREYPIIKLSVFELEEATLKAREFLKKIQKEDHINDSKSRLLIRTEANNYIGIYK